MFRKEAVRAYVAPDLRGGLLHVTRPLALLLYGPVFALFVIVLVVASVGRVHVYARGRGMVRPTGGVVSVRATASGTITRVLAHEGHTIEAGQTLFEIDRATPDAPASASRRIEITVPRAGSVDDIAVEVGSYVREGDPLATVVPARARLVGFMAVPERYRPQLARGQSVRLRLDAYPYEELGLARGRILRVRESLLDERWARELASIGDPVATASVLVEVKLEGMPAGTADHFRNGMLFTGEVGVRQPRIASLLLPPLESIFGP